MLEIKIYLRKTGKRRTHRQNHRQKSGCTFLCIEGSSVPHHNVL